MKASRSGGCAALVLLALVVGGCHASRPAAASGDRLSVDRLYPLRAGSVWTYDVDTGDGSAPTLAITRVTKSAGGKAEVSSGGAPIEYEQRPDGLYRGDRGIYVFKLPLRPGATWETSGGASAQVVTLDKQLETPAGPFAGCVEVLESGGSVPKLVRTVFCPDVGPVEVESSVALPVAGSQARVVARLRGYDFSGALQPTLPAN